MVHGHHLLADGEGETVPRGDSGLVQSACAGLAVVEHLRRRLFLNALDEALSLGRKTEIFNSDHDSQFTGEEFTGRLLGQGIQISMDGKGRALDNVIVGWFWRNVKYEYVYLHAPAAGLELHCGLKEYMEFYCHRRGHETLLYAVPADVYARRKSHEGYPGLSMPPLDLQGFLRDYAALSPPQGGHDVPAHPSPGLNGACRSSRRSA